METLNELQKKILEVFYDTQCNEDTGNFNDDETPSVRYHLLEKELGLTRDRIKPDLLDLRNKGIIYLGMTVNYDYQPSGSGWILDEKKGAELVKQLFFKEQDDISQ